MKNIFQTSVLIIVLAAGTIYSQAIGDLMVFTAKVSNDRTIQLNWQTKNESNSNKFNIERKTTSNDWKTISSVKAAGLSNSPREYSFQDKQLQSDVYQYRLRIIENDTTFEFSKIVQSEITLPKNFVLNQNYPNPFNPSTKISYTLPSDSKVILDIFNISGEMVCQLVNQDQSAGFYSVDFNTLLFGSHITSGVYFYHITVSNQVEGTNFSSIKKMMLLK